jgi:hypothetical protein
MKRAKPTPIKPETRPREITDLMIRHLVEFYNGAINSSRGYIMTPEIGALNLLAEHGFMAKRSGQSYVITQRGIAVVIKMYNDGRIVRVSAE